VAGGDGPAWGWAGAPPQGFVSGSVHASYLHLHWAGVPGLAERMVRSCV
jgi:cobyrinic acid a,c-diamide synthase